MSLRIAFYAPMKSPNHSVPSGDRTIARLLISALRGAGHSVYVISGFRSWAPTPERQEALRTEARLERNRIADVLTRDRPDVWMTYHLSFKAPDWLGPALCARARLPYVIAEASDSPARARGPWSRAVAEVRDALHRAHTVFLMKERDRRALELLPGITGKLVRLPAFLESDEMPLARYGPRKGPARLLTVAMMRPGDKLESYRLLAAALAHVAAPWQLTIAGDGPARKEVTALFQSFGSRVMFTGIVEGAKLRSFYQQSDIFVWPGIGEGIGMVYLEAQEAGLPVAACATAGVPDVVRHGQTGLLRPAGDARALAAALSALIADSRMRERFGRSAARHVRVSHQMGTAQRILAAVLSRWEDAA